MDVSKLCAYCFNIKGSQELCPYCNWRDDTPPGSAFYLPPQTILHGKYLLGRVLGQGGFGITYLALDLDLGVKLAIKEYFPREFAGRTNGEFSVSVFSGDAQTYFREGLEKFLEEAKTLARLEGHPNIVSVRDFFRENGTAYFTMNYLEGATLKEYLNNRSAPLDFASALQIINPIMDALKEIHSRGILHRDISPDNIFITEKGVVKILDFGAARQAMGEHSKSFSIILKPGYAPEEQYRSKGNQGAWTDIYALSATLYRMLCGKTPPDSLDRLNGEVLAPPSQFGVLIPASCEAALLKGLAVKAQDRYQNIGDYQSALKAGLSARPVELIPASSSVRPVPPAPLSNAFSPPGSLSAPIIQPPASHPPKDNSQQQPRISTLLMGLASFACLLVIALGIYYYQSQDDPKQLNISVSSSSVSQNGSTQSVAGSIQSTPEKVVRDFYDSISSKNYQSVASLLGGEMLANFSQEALSQTDLNITGYRVLENQSINASQARITVEANFLDSAKNSYKITDVFLLEYRNGRWLIIQLMDEKY